MKCPRGCQCRKHNRQSKIDIDEIRALHAEGLTTAEIAERIDASAKTVYNRLSHLGIKSNRDMRPRKQDRETLLRAWAKRKGLSGEEAERYVEEGLRYGSLKERRRAERKAAKAAKAEPVERKPKPSYGRMSAKAKVEALAEPIKTTCGHCGRSHVGTLAESKAWFRLHKHGPPVEGEHLPAPVVGMPTRRKGERRPIRPRVAAPALD